MSRNKDRLGGHSPEPAEAPAQAVEKAFDPLSFVAPTEFVELPSKGNYPEGHPLCGEEVLEIRFMTAKEEDILSSQTLLKKGLAIERMLDSLIIDNKIKAQDLWIGDRNALIVAARISGYGASYKTQVNCPACGEHNHMDFDLTKQQIEESEISDELNLSKLDNGNFSCKMPYSKFNIEFRLLDGRDEQTLAKLMSDKKKRKMVETNLTDQFKMMIVAIEGHKDRQVIARYVDNMPTLDSTQLRGCYKVASPDVKVTSAFECNSCGYSQEMEVPFNTDFFWPDR